MMASTESSLLPLRVLTGLPAQRVLVFAPHPDDEVFGCGGTLCRLASAAAAIRVIIATDGGEEPPTGMSREAYVEQRQNESRTAAKHLGGYELVFWPHADRGLRYGERLVEACRAAIQEWGAECVLAPSHYEVHPDHRALAMAALEAARRHQGCSIAFYEVGQPLPQPNVLIDIGPVAKQKRAAMECFASQLIRQPYPDQIEALNRYRCYHAQGLSAAEALLWLSPEALTAADDPLWLFRSEHARQAALGLSADEAALPRVSVIVRSIDRPTLDDALDSIALQTYPNIEVVLVNAKGPEHRPMPTWCGRFPLRFIGGGRPLSRAAAANTGLEAASGEYLIFLDDDDWFEPGHIAGLVAAARKVAAPVVYSGARTVGESSMRIFNRPFDRLRLIGGNYIPIHTLLFARALVIQGCRFDESFDLYEDWDFLIQLALQMPFRHLDAVTAVYRVHADGSGAQTDMAACQSARRRLFAKWRTSLSARLDESDWLDLFERVQLLDEKQELLAAAQQECLALRAECEGLRAECEGLRAECEGLRAECEGLRAERRAILNSTSWRITTPLRLIGRLVGHRTQ